MNRVLFIYAKLVLWLGNGLVAHSKWIVAKVQTTAPLIDGK